MSFQSYNELPNIINERLNAQEMLDVKREIQEQISFTEEQRKIFFSILEDIELRRSPVSDLLTMLQEKIPFDLDIAKKVALKLWREYFFMVQDYYGSCSELINAHGGNSAACAEKATAFLHPHRQLKKFILSTLYELSPELSEEYGYELIDQLIERALEKVRKHGVMEHFTLFLQSKEIKGVDPEKIADAIELLVLSGAFSAQHAWYYFTLADNVIRARPFVEISSIEVSKNEEKKMNQEEFMQELKNAFDHLPPEVKDVFLSEEMQGKIKTYSAQYPSFELILMRTAIKDIQLNDLALVLHKEYHLGPEKSSALRDEIVKTFFEPVMWYFTGAAKPPEVPETIMPKPEPKKQMPAQQARTPSPEQQEKQPVLQEQPKEVSQKMPLKQQALAPQRLESSDKTLISVTGSRIESGMTEGGSAPQESVKQELSVTQTQSPKVEHRRAESYEALADEVMQKCAISLSEDCASRVRRALVTRIRNIRTNIETREKLISEMAQGGCGITNEQAECLTKEAALLANDIQKKLLIVGTPPPLPPLKSFLQPIPPPPAPSPEPEAPPEPMEKPPLPLEVSTAKPVETLPPPEAPAALPIIEESPKPIESPKPEPPLPQSPPPIKIPLPPKPPPPPKPVEPIKPTLSKPSAVQEKAPAGLAIEEVDGIPTLIEKSAVPQESQKQTSQAPVQPAKPVAKSEPQTLKVEIKKTQTEVPHEKKLTVSDVKKAPHLVGPIEELQSFTLKDFRRISANPVQAANRIFDKIQNLEKESLPKKMEAIDAWKKSEVNQLYVQIGKESFGKGMPIATVIEQRKNAGQEFLTEAEFDALLDLSTMLRH